MPVFPKDESGIFDLGSRLFDGIYKYTSVFPNPPVGTFCLMMNLTNFDVCRQKVLTARSLAETARLAKDRALANLVEALKANLRYAENITNGEDAKLKLLGWSGRGTAKSLPAPGQPGLLRIAKQGLGWITLIWESSRSGGKTKAYTIHRRQGESGQWSTIHTAVETEANLVDQPRGVTLEYRITAVNKAGTSEPGNTITVVL
jgi:hypothetical protein